ncbi:hypothetical protein [Amycolatopsis rhizosphaerae]|uniref:hypothetical protein n=1 Tax=Amycolatopsis rhizosphaerae TaxID=2053003 RepID=UPI001FE38DF5|nr:hypothetical protein [Amycolatopsis rhizosphaerae]
MMGVGQVLVRSIGLSAVHTVAGIGWDVTAVEPRERVRVGVGLAGLTRVVVSAVG